MSNNGVKMIPLNASSRLNFLRTTIDEIPTTRPTDTSCSSLGRIELTALSPPMASPGVAIATPTNVKIRFNIANIITVMKNDLRSMP